METLIQQLREKQMLSKLIGEAPAFVQAIGDLPSVASSDAAVLISGETGTGKELVARAIHYLGNRAGFPFVPLNCGSLPETLLEEELFGHERGAFTDAQSKREGLIAQAERGTLFLDEIDTLSHKAQVDLLRVLQEKTFRSLGSSTERKVDVRFVGATNSPPDQLVSSGSFRADLYYRLAVFSIDLPPLRNRKTDILLLASHFLQKHQPAGKNLKLSLDACDALLKWAWPGNVRELENAIIRGIHLSVTGFIDVPDLRLPDSFTKPHTPGLEQSEQAVTTLRPLRVMKRDAVEAFEKDYLTKLLQQNGGNVTEAARLAGKERRAFGKLLKKYRLDAQFPSDQQSSSH